MLHMASTVQENAKIYVMRNWLKDEQGKYTVGRKRQIYEEDDTRRTCGWTDVALATMDRDTEVTTERRRPVNSGREQGGTLAKAKGETIVLDNEWIGGAR